MNEKTIYDIYIEMRVNENVYENDVVHTTTSDFNYNSLLGCFDELATRRVKVRAEHIGEDYSEFVAEKSRTGGKYGYDTYRVLEVLS